MTSRWQPAARTPLRLSHDGSLCLLVHLYEEQRALAAKAAFPRAHPQQVHLVTFGRSSAQPPSSSSSGAGIPAVTVGLSDGSPDWARTLLGLRAALLQAPSAAFFMKADDDSFVYVAHVQAFMKMLLDAGLQPMQQRRMWAQLWQDDSLGRPVPVPVPSGGAGYLLTNAAVRALVGDIWQRCLEPLGLVQAAAQCGNGTTIPPPATPAGTSKDRDEGSILAAQQRPALAAHCAHPEAWYIVSAERENEAAFLALADPQSVLYGHSRVAKLRVALDKTRQGARRFHPGPLRRASVPGHYQDRAEPTPLAALPQPSADCAAAPLSSLCPF